MRAIRGQVYRRVLAGGVAAVAVLALTACGGGDASAPPTSGPGASAGADGADGGSSDAGGGAVSREPLLEAKQLTTLDQPIKYPTKGAAAVSSYLLTLEPGQETGWHKNRVPLYVQVMEGTLHVEYDAGVVKDYPAGSTFMEGQGIWHNGSNVTNDAVKALLVYFGATGVKNTVERAS